MSTDGWCSLAAETAIVPRTVSLLVTSDGGQIEKGVKYYYEDIKRVALIGSLPWNNEKIFSSSPNPFPSGLGASYGKIREWRQHDPANGEGPSHADEETEAWHKRSCCYPFEMLTGWRW